MRISTLLIGVLLLLAVGWMITSFVLPATDIAAEHIGQQKAGKAIVPSHLNEDDVRGKAQQADR